MILSTLISMLSGGLLRALPEIFAFFNKKADNDHEYRMLQAQVEMEKTRSENKQAEIVTQGNVDQALAQLNDQMEALKGQMQKTGVAIVDALNFLVRPLTTYIFLAMFCWYKTALLILALGQTDAWHAILQVYTQDDANMLTTILSFWFVGRVFDKKQ